MNSTVALLALMTPGATENQFVRAVLDTGLFAQAILLLIVMFSVVSWAVIFAKIWQYRKVKLCNEKFLNDFERLGGDFGTLNQSADKYQSGTYAPIFAEAFRELRSVGKIQDGQLIFDRPHLSLIHKRIERTVAQQMTRLEQSLIVLATTANVTPFLGLFGTVWGVLGTFMTMAEISSTLTLQMIGPGIAEALTTTIFGLGAAIPATIAFNHLVSRVAVYRTDMEDFSLRLLAVLEKNIIARSMAPTPPVSHRRTQRDTGVTIPEEVSL